MLDIEPAITMKRNALVATSNIAISFRERTGKSPTGNQGAVSIRSYTRKNLLEPKFKQESVTFMPPNKEVKINNTKPFPVNWT